MEKSANEFRSLLSLGFINLFSEHVQFNDYVRDVKKSPEKNQKNL